MMNVFIKQARSCYLMRKETVIRGDKPKCVRIFQACVGCDPSDRSSSAGRRQRGELHGEAGSTEWLAVRSGARLEAERGLLAWNALGKLGIEYRLSVLSVSARAAFILSRIGKPSKDGKTHDAFADTPERRHSRLNSTFWINPQTAPSLLAEHTALNLSELYGRPVVEEGVLALETNTLNRSKIRPGPRWD
jgi:hypothetical protein